MVSPQLSLWPHPLTHSKLARRSSVWFHRHNGAGADGCHRGRPAGIGSSRYRLLLRPGEHGNLPYRCILAYPAGAHEAIFSTTVHVLFCAATSRLGCVHLGLPAQLETALMSPARVALSPPVPQPFPATCCQAPFFSRRGGHRTRFAAPVQTLAWPVALLAFALWAGAGWSIAHLPRTQPSSYFGAAPSISGRLVLFRVCHRLGGPASASRQDQCADGQPCGGCEGCPSALSPSAHTTYQHAPTTRPPTRPPATLARPTPPLSLPVPAPLFSLAPTPPPLMRALTLHLLPHPPLSHASPEPDAPA